LKRATVVASLAALILSLPASSSIELPRDTQGGTSLLRGASIRKSRRCIADRKSNSMAGWCGGAS
jgi:hypothetical protein